MRPTKREDFWIWAVCLYIRMEGLQGNTKRKPTMPGVFCLAPNRRRPWIWVDFGDKGVWVAAFRVQFQRVAGAGDTTWAYFRLRFWAWCSRESKKKNNPSGGLQNFCKPGQCFQKRPALRSDSLWFPFEFAIMGPYIWDGSGW